MPDLGDFREAFPDPHEEGMHSAQALGCVLLALIFSCALVAAVALCYYHGR